MSLIEDISGRRRVGGWTYFSTDSWVPGFSTDRWGTSESEGAQSDTREVGPSRRYQKTVKRTLPFPEGRWPSRVTDGVRGDGSSSQRSLETVSEFRDDPLIGRVFSKTRIDKWSNNILYVSHETYLNNAPMYLLNWKSTGSLGWYSKGLKSSHRIGCPKKS